MEDLKFIVDTYGIEITIIVYSAIGSFYLIKKILETMFDNYISTGKQKKIIAYENAIQRSTITYKLLVEKELDSYEKYFTFASNLVTDIQDVEYNYLEDNNDKLKEYILKVLDTIPRLKKDVIIYESYYDSSVREEIFLLLSLLQNDFVYNVENIMLKRIEKEKVKEICNKILKQIAAISSLIYFREQEMSR